MSIAVLLAFTPTVHAVDVTDAQIAAAISGGQKYLFDSFKSDSDTSGHWSGYSDLAGTGSAVAALLETGAYGDPAYAAIIDKPSPISRHLYIRTVAFTATAATKLMKRGFPSRPSRCMVRQKLRMPTTRQSCRMPSPICSTPRITIPNYPVAVGGWGYDASYHTGSWTGSFQHPVCRDGAVLWFPVPGSAHQGAALDDIVTAKS